jgi:hypothetical protein
MAFFAPKSLERLFERRHVNQIIGAQNETQRIYRLTIDDLSKQIKNLQSKRKLEPSKYGAQLLRNKELRKQLKQMQRSLYRRLYDTVKAEVAAAWAMANLKNDKLVKDYFKGTQIAVSQQFTRANTAALDNFISRKTAGLSLSEKVWNMSNDSQRLVEDWLASGITQGKSAQSISRDMYRMMGDPTTAKVIDDTGKAVRFSKLSDFVRTPAPKGHYKNPRKSIFRLVRNEVNKSYRNADHLRMQQLDFVVGKRIQLSAAHADFDVCDNLAGDYPKTFIFDGWHVNCLCYVTTILMSKDEFRQKIKPSDSKNHIARVPVKAERLVKTVHEGKVQVKGASSFQNSPWFKENFKNGKPVGKVGGGNSKVKPYKTRQDLIYDGDPEKYLQKAKKV